MGRVLGASLPSISANSARTAVGGHTQEGGGTQLRNTAQLGGGLHRGKPNIAGWVVIAHCVQNMEDGYRGGEGCRVMWKQPDIMHPVVQLSHRLILREQQFSQYISKTKFVRG